MKNISEKNQQCAFRVYSFFRREIHNAILSEINSKMKNWGILIMCFILSPTLYPVNIIQLTDMHSGGDDPRTLHSVIESACNENASMYIVTGDIVNCGMQTYWKHDNPNVTDYNVAQTLVRKNWLRIPGNHEYAWTGYGGSAEFERQFGARHWIKDIDNWRFIGLDLGIPYSHNAYIDPNELLWLENRMKEAEGKSFALCIHQPLFSSHILNEESLVQLCEKYPVKLVLSGHLHENFVYNVNKIPVIVTGAAYEGWYSMLNIEGKKVELVSKNVLASPPRQYAYQIYDADGRVNPKFQYSEYKVENAAIYAQPLRIKDSLFFSNSAGHLWRLQLPEKGQKFTAKSFRSSLCKIGDFNGNLAFPFSNSEGAVCWLSDHGQLILPAGKTELNRTISCAPLVYKNLIVAGTLAGTIIFYDTDKMDIQKEIDLETASSVSGITADQNGVYICSLDETIRCIDWDGTLKWINKLSNKNYSYSVYPSEPILYNGIIYLSSNDKKAVAINCNNGAKIWESEIGTCNTFTPALLKNAACSSDRFVIGGENGVLSELDLKSGKKADLWRNPGFQIITGAVDKGNIFVNCWNGYLLRWKDGEIQIWKYTIPEHYNRNIPIPLDKEVLLPCWNGNFLSFSLE